LLDAAKVERNISTADSTIVEMATEQPNMAYAGTENRITACVSRISFTAFFAFVEMAIPHFRVPIKS
jgi:hypothetical protein